MPFEAPTMAAVRALRERLGSSVYRTPVVRCAGLEDRLDNGTRVFGKLEFLQPTGTFKIRGALAVIGSLDARQLAAGVTAVSAGNHAMATAYAARVAGTTAKIAMLESASRARIDACRALGAELVLTGDIHEAFDAAEAIERREGRTFVHPFEGPLVATGTGTVGLEICEQHDAFDAVIIPVGGGGLFGGMANAIRSLRPGVRLIGVEPAGAASMRASLDSGAPARLGKVATIADSLAPPFALPYSFELCRRNMDELVVVDDDELKAAMKTLYRVMKIAVEPACAATTAALLGPLAESLAGRSVMLTFCGSNIDWPTFAAYVSAVKSDAD